MAMAPTAIENVDAPGDEDAHRDRDRHEVVAGRPDEVLDHLVVGRPRQFDRGHHVPWVAANQHDAGRSTATSVPAPMAIPTSAVASAGASFTPSPTMATLRPPSWKRLTAAALSAGRTCAATSSMPRRRATESATAWLSPVIIATRTPRACSESIASLDSGRISSSMATRPATAPSTTTWRTVRPC